MLNIDSIDIKSNDDEKVYMDINNMYSDLTTIYEELYDKYGAHSQVIFEFFKYLTINYQIKAKYEFGLRVPNIGAIIFETDNDTLINNPTEASAAILDIRTFLDKLEYIYNNINDILIMINWIINDAIIDYNIVLSDIRSAVRNVLKTYGLRFENRNTVFNATSGTFEIKKLYLGSTNIDVPYAEKLKSTNNRYIKRDIFEDVYKAMADVAVLNHYEYWYTKYQQYLKYREIDDIIVNKLYKGKFGEEAIIVYSNVLRRLYNIKIDLNNIDKHKYTYIDFSDTCKEKISLFNVDLDNDKIDYCLSKYASVRKYFDDNVILFELDHSSVHDEAAKTNEENKKGLPKQEALSRIHSNKVFDIYLDDLKDEVRKEYLKQAELDEDDVTEIDWPITTIIL